MKNKAYYFLFVLYLLMFGFILYINGVFTGQITSRSNLVINISFLLLIGILMVISAISFGRLNQATDALLDAADFVAAFQKRQGLYISCIEEIAYRRGFINKEQLLELAKPLMKTAYGQYLVEIAEGL